MDADLVDADLEADRHPAPEAAPRAARHSDYQGGQGFEAPDDEHIPSEILNQRICDFDLKLEGRPLGRVIERFQSELAARGVRRLVPRFYLSDEWGVCEGTVAIGIPFYLADKRLLRVQKVKSGRIEGTTEGDILRYLRHEMGHVVNYGYRLYVTEDWTRHFGPMARPYAEDYRALPFSPEFVRHLPGGYAQKHPDEDWAETFAVWLTPDLDWRAMYADSPGALAKLEYCERTMSALAERDPEVTESVLEGEASAIQLTLQEYYDQVELGEITIPRSLDGDLAMIFNPAYAGVPPADEAGRSGSAALLLQRQRDALAGAVYLWTGVNPELVRTLVTHLSRRADELELTYPLGSRDTVVVQMTGFLTTLAMNYVYKGNFIAK
jgi:hypothetical protein